MPAHPSVETEHGMSATEMTQTPLTLCHPHLNLTCAVGLQSDFAVLN